MLVSRVVEGAALLPSLRFAENPAATLRMFVLRLLHTSPQEVQRIVNLAHATKIDTLSRAFSALGKQLEIRAV
ncbi:hypothetical protein FACS1894185_1960 [Betaproteobacteria bacterium]|nr:hypothetical protein FACS1894185_1960 [Betaproteobacteria bacterium]